MTDLLFRMPNTVSWVNADTWPPAGGNYILCVTERQMSVIRQMVYPRCTTPGAFAARAYGDYFQMPTDEQQRQFNEEVDDLLSKLSKEEAVSELQLLTAIENVGRDVPAPTPWVASFGNANLAAGSNNGTVFQVGDANRVVVKHVAWYVVSTTIAEVRLYADIAGTLAAVNQVATPVSGVRQFRDLHLILDAGDKVTYALTGATAGDDLYVQMTGYVVAYPIIEG